MIARVVTVVLLWAPLLLALTLILPFRPEEPAPHLVTATALALIGERVLRTLFLAPVAPPGEGRHRIVPRYPARGVVTAALGLGIGVHTIWQIGEAGALGALHLLSFVIGAGCIWLARAYRGLPYWGGWIRLQEGMLEVTLPAADGGYRIPVGQIRTVHRREGDGSFLIETPWRERDLLVLTRSAWGRFSVEDSEALYQDLAQVAEVASVRTLLGLTRRRR